ncbi:hypothetical protein EXIGLDRAFT_833318 [Exidia glandulosa HHB12029]|uniref:F-box domain-containing protein n=1 Tax=Exidia glandulosa HHB12029 TaxID=1314781 RepID=A0A165KU77_EXIGL|nr:hypothetical protein EXIGLDRAFT_833318 [Exidia glandulosa HHB12029]
MSSVARSQQLARMRADEDFLALTDARIGALRRADSAAQERLAIAQAEADATRAELTALEVRQLQLRSDIGQMRLDHRRMLWTQAIPLDCLRQIFEETTSIPTAEWAEFGCGGHSRKCMMAPFALAAVCARWRQLALGVPVLWTYICAGVLRPGQPLAATLSRIHCLLQRSRGSPLDIRLQLQDCLPETLTDVSDLLALIACHARRVRSMDLWLPKGINREPALDMLKAPLPQLTHLCVIAGTRQLEGCDSYLPYAPKLSHLELQGTGFTCSPQYQIFGNMRSLTLWAPYPSEQVASILQSVLETLERLYVASVSLLSGIRTPITFPRLCNLSMGNVSASSISPDMIVAPRLQALTFPGKTMTDSAAARLVESVGSNVTSLTLVDSDIPPSLPRLLQGLRRVETLRLLVSDQYPKYTVSDEFFFELATGAPTIWPKLRSIQLDGCESNKTLGDGLVKLIRARNFPAADTIRPAAPEEKPCRLEQVEAPGAPSWLRSSIVHLLSRS